MKFVTLGLFVGAALFGAVIHYAPTPESITPMGARNMMTIEEYVRKHIGTLSPERPVLGGTFYITDMQINANNQTGIVWYEDGHIALVADFAYARNTSHNLIITSFVVRK